MIVVAAKTPELRSQAYLLRHGVFVLEQRVPPALERDEHDETAFHVVALEAGRCIGTGRLVRQPGGVGRIGRMAVDPAFRRAGVGGKVLAALEKKAREDGLRELELHAQCQVEPFYAKRGYVREGEVFEEAGIDHAVMRKRITTGP
jgi:predicted GNAT family N-acyltransferase